MQCASPSIANGLLPVVFLPSGHRHHQTIFPLLLINPLVKNYQFPAILEYCTKSFILFFYSLH